MFALLKQPTVENIAAKRDIALKFIRNEFTLCHNYFQLYSTVVGRDFILFGEMFSKLQICFILERVKGR